MKCSYCQVIPASIAPPLADNIDPETGAYILHQYTYGREDVLPDLPALIASSAAGCDMCHVVRGRILAAFPEWLEVNGYQRPSDDQATPCRIGTFGLCRENDVLGPCYKSAQDAPYELRFRVTVPSVGDMPIEIPLHIRASEGSSAATLGGLRRRLIPKDPLAPQNVRNIRGLVEQCLRGHVACQIGRQRQFVPTRLLYVGDPADEHIILETTGRSQQCHKYVALSYMWGSDTHFTTTTRQSLHEPNIRLASLPATFRDAVYVCHALGVKHLWVDALCIVQNDTDDWAKESSQMHRIYANAHFVLAATRSCSASDGFLQQRHNEEVQFSYPSTAFDISSDTFAVVSDRHPRLYNDLYSNVELSPWNKRGWTFQERSLASRTVHFSETMLFFECRTTDWIEDGRPLASIVGRVGRLVVHDKFGTRLSRHDLLNCWYSMVGQYNTRTITFPHDKFSAISGVAHEVGQLLGDTYVAGLWLTDLDNGLLWWPDSDYLAGLSSSPVPKRISQWIAPSWSWASMTGFLYFDHLPLHTHSQMSIIAIDVVPDSEDYMGCLRSASLTVLAKLSQIESFQRQLDAGNAWDISVNGTLTSCRAIFDNGNHVAPAPIYALLIRIAYGAPIELQCLILQDVENQPGSFQRVGVLLTSGRAADGSDGPHFFEDVKPQPVRLL